MTQRPIKFKAVYEGKIYPVAGITFGGGYSGDCKSVTLIGDTMIWSVNFKDVILIQFTGLLDNKEKEIWEGDILKTVEDGNREVIFRKGCFGVVTERPTTTEDGTEYYPEFYTLDYEGGYSLRIQIDDKYQEKDILEVVGNIYENPELLS